MSRTMSRRVYRLRPSSERYRVILVPVIMLSLCFSAGAGELAEAEKSGLVLEKVEPWAPSAEAAAKTSRTEQGEMLIEANGTLTCSGGWQFHFANVRGGQAYRIRAQAEHHGLPSPRDCLEAQVLWGKWDPRDPNWGVTPINYLLPKRRSAESIDWECSVRAPAGATSLTVRYTFRWSDHGSSRWTPPVIEPIALPEPKPVKICIVNNTRQTSKRITMRPLSDGLDLPKDIAARVDLWGSLVWAACAEKPQLIVTPELVISGKGFLDGAVTVPGPATRPFEEIARRNQVCVVLGLRQRDQKAVYNSAVVISPAGKVQGIYHKVHLATGEDATGVTPGDGFPVFSTPVGRIGCVICMDTMLSESSRMLALGGADIICMPIMGDLRADRFSPGQPIFNEGRWKAIMRTRALDNQVCMVVARNDVQGSCIIDRKGDILAWNEGDQEFIYATLPAEDDRRVSDGSDVREVTFLLRRPHLYKPYSDQENLGPLRVTAEPPATIAGDGR